MTVLELLENTTRYFAKHDVPSPRLTIELMLAEIMQKTRMQLYLEFDQPVSDPVMDRLRPLVKRRAEGERSNTCSAARPSPVTALPSRPTS